MGQLDGADVRFRGPHPDTSLHCEITEMGLAHRVVCLFTLQHMLALTSPIPRWITHMQMVTHLSPM